jgi:hypothetical protein
MCLCDRLAFLEAKTNQNEDQPRLHLAPIY